MGRAATHHQVAQGSIQPGLERLHISKLPKVLLQTLSSCSASSLSTYILMFLCTPGTSCSSGSCSLIKNTLVNSLIRMMRKIQSCHGCQSSEPVKRSGHWPETYSPFWWNLLSLSVQSGQEPALQEGPINSWHHPTRLFNFRVLFVFSGFKCSVHSWGRPAC